jgi:YspA, cpYpsA-related SLOG family
MRVLICGDRNWTDRRRIRWYLKTLPVGSVIIHGNAPGADRIAGELASELGFEVIAFPAQWWRYGRAAGPLRNKQMIDEGRPDKVAYAHDDLDASTGTRGMVAQARSAGIPVERIE